MIRQKVCMLGSFAVGKTSLVRRFVHRVYSDHYQTTLGVKVDKKSLEIGARQVELMLWDIAGEDEFFTVPSSYLRGSSGYFLVVDGTRASTLDVACTLRDRAEEALGSVPRLWLFNKNDLRTEWELDLSALVGGLLDGEQYVETSALNGAGVEDAFTELTRRMIGGEEER